MMPTAERWAWAVITWAVIITLAWLVMGTAGEPTAPPHGKFNPVVHELGLFVKVHEAEFYKFPCPCGGHDSVAESFASGHPCGVCISVAQSAQRMVEDGRDWAYVNAAIHKQFDPAWVRMIGRTLPKRLMP